MEADDVRSIAKDGRSRDRSSGSDGESVVGAFGLSSSATAAILSMLANKLRLD